MGIFGKPPDAKAPEAGVPARPAPLLGPSASPSPSTAPSRGAMGPCVIGAKTTIKGEILGDEDVLIEGVVEGQILVSRDVRIGPGGSVKATIDAHSVVVSGELNGDCTASGRVEIQATGRVTGNIRAPKIVIAEGAVFRGNSDMSARKDDRKDKVAAS